MNKTSNFEFNLPDGTDNVDVEVLNANMDKLDEIFADIYSKLTPQPTGDIIIDTRDPNNYHFDADNAIIYNAFDKSYNLNIGDIYDCTIEYYDEDDTPTGTETLTVVDISEGTYPNGAPALISNISCCVVLDKCQYKFVPGEEPTLISSDVTNWLAPVTIQDDQPVVVPAVVTFRKKQIQEGLPRTLDINDFEDSFSQNVWYDGLGKLDLAIGTDYQVTMRSSGGTEYTATATAIDGDSILGTSNNVPTIVIQPSSEVMSRFNGIISAIIIGDGICGFSPTAGDSITYGNGFAVNFMTLSASEGKSQILEYAEEITISETV